MAAIWSVNPNDGVEGGNGSFIFPRNESEQDKTYTVTYSDGDKVCSKTVVVMARSIDCCREITVNEPSDMIPASGITATTEITTFTSTCGFDGITVRGSNGLTVSTNNGTIYIDSCDENEDEETKDYTIYIDYNGSECKTITITQEGGIKCECSSMSKFVDVTQRIYGNDRQENVLIATADTQGCGEVSANTNSDMLEGRELVREEIGDYQYAFKATITQNPTSSNRSADINLYFKKKGSSGYEPCDNYALTILQTQNPPDCESMSFNGDLVNDVIDLEGNEEYSINRAVQILNMHYDTSFTVDYPCGYYAIKLTVLEGGEDAVKYYKFNKLCTSEFDYLSHLTISENTQRSSRTIKLKFTAYHSVIFNDSRSEYSNSDWDGGTPCTSCTLTFNQPGVPDECNCEDYYLRFVKNIGTEIDTIELSRTDTSMPFYVKPEGVSSEKPCAKIIPEDKYTFSISYDGNFITSVEYIGYNTTFTFYEFKVNVNENPLEDKEGTITICLKELSSGNECACNNLNVFQHGLNDCEDCERDVKANIKPSSNIRANGNSDGSIIVLGDICSYNYDFDFVDSDGITPKTYDWISGLRLVSAYGQDFYIYANMNPNLTNSQRTAYVKVTPLNEQGTGELIERCSAIVPIIQPNMNECNCDNLIDDAHHTSSARVTSDVFYVGEDNVKIAEITVSSITTDISCINLNIRTTQGYFTKGHYVDNPRTGVTSSVYGYAVTKTFDVYADIINNSGRAIDDQGVSASIDYQVMINGIKCNFNGQFSILIKERQS